MKRVPTVEEMSYEYLDGTIIAFLRGKKPLAWLEVCLGSTSPAGVRRVFEDRRPFYVQHQELYDRGRLKALENRLRADGILMR